MANRKISDLTALTAPVTGDLLPIVDISEAAAADKNKKITYGTFLSSVPLGTAAAPSIAFTGDNTGIYSPGADQLAIATGGTGRLFIDAAGLVGIHTTSPARKLVISNSGAEGLETGPGESANLNLQLHYNRSGSAYVTNKIDAADHLFFTSATERARIDSSSNGRLLVGTSTAVGEYTLQIEADNASDPTGGAVLLRRRLSNATISSPGFQLGTIAAGSQTNVGGFIRFESDGGWGSGDYPTRLLFSTTADGAASPTEAMRIKSTGIINFSNAPTYADNTAATVGGLAVGDVYKTVLGVLMIRF